MLATPNLETPARTISLSVGAGVNYYDAAATNREADFGAWLSTVSEDFYFGSATRCVVIARIRREVRNNPYLAGLVAKFPEAIGQPVLRSRTKNRGFNLAKDTFWYSLAKRLTPTGDSLRTVVDLLKSEMLVAGEIFFIKLPSGRLQLVPSEYCGSPNSDTAADAKGRKEVNGIIYAATGEVAGFRFGQLEASGILNFSSSTVVDARHVIHVYKKDRVQMGRGLPWLLPCLRPAHDLYEITRAKTKQIKDITSIFGTIEKAGASSFLNGLDAPALGENGEPVTETPDAAADKVKTGPVRVELRPGTFIALEPGEKLNTLSSKYEAADYKELIMLMLHAISSPIGLPVELWFSGLGDVNYSGFKGLGVQWDARRKDLHAWLEEAFLDPFHEWRMGLAFIMGELPPVPPGGQPDEIDWKWRRTAVLDEEKARKSNATGLDSGEIDLGDVWEERGLYAEDVFAARRQLWIKGQIAAGILKDEGDHADVIVPIEFLMRGRLPGEVSGVKPAEVIAIDPATGEPAAA
jgi:hypothetical protein